MTDVVPGTRLQEILAVDDDAWCISVLPRNDPDSKRVLADASNG